MAILVSVRITEPEPNRNDFGFGRSLRKSEPFKCTNCITYEYGFLASNLELLRPTGLFKILTIVNAIAIVFIQF